MYIYIYIRIYIYICIDTKRDKILDAQMLFGVFEEVHSGRFLEGFLEGKPDFPTECKTLHPRTNPQGFPEAKTKVCVFFVFFIVGLPESSESVPGEIRKEAGNYPEATFT